ncbi:hypothetical protein EMPS_09981 [Entomortierella parvispora]|uniref:Uncharacterized protein n=1 Tax=Entomortierella parvispora TaxID=205924 RepID=A0A9P3HJ65_9FUNG|nr:hypothetical protein EMPS_09981 [Entomortierella parvispora]
MSKRPSEQTLDHPGAQIAKVDHVGSDNHLDDSFVSLKAQLALELFGSRPAKHETLAVEYVARMWQSPAPAPTIEGFHSFLLDVDPPPPPSGIVRSWNKLKDYFTAGNNNVFEHFDNFPSLVAAFAAAPRIPETSPVGLASVPDVTYLPPRQSVTQNKSKGSKAGSSSSNNNSNGSNGSSGSGSGSGSSRSSTISGGQLSPSTILKMRTLFRKNFDEYEGNAWELPSGAILDNLLADHIEKLPSESALHSFIIEDVKGILQMVTDETDRALLKTTLMDRSTEQLSALSPPEKAFLKKYNLPPDHLRNLLATSGWRTVGNSLKKKPDDEFQEAAHFSIQYLFTIYRQVGMVVPTDSTESWYTHVLWHFIGVLMHCPFRLEYQPGEAHSRASSHRRNKNRTREERQYTGHKADGLVITKLSRFELCAIEAAKKDNGPNGSKALDDTRKLAKMTKDMHDSVRDAATTNIRDTLVTFGARISALTITLYTMRQRPGRFYQLCTESSVSLPNMWTEENTMAVLGVLERILVFRKAMVRMGQQIPQWTSVSVGGSDPGSHDDKLAATLTSPHLIPDTDLTAVETVPEISLS